MFRGSDLPDMTGLIYFAMFSIVVTVIVVPAGILWAIWWAWNHVTIH